MSEGGCGRIVVVHRFVVGRSFRERGGVQMQRAGGGRRGDRRVGTGFEGLRESECRGKGGCGARWTMWSGMVGGEVGPGIRKRMGAILGWWEEVK